MKGKFELSNLEWESILTNGLREKVYTRRDIKLFIKLVKERISLYTEKGIANGINDIIDKFAGEGLL